MSIKEQINTIKENWLIVTLLVVFVLVFAGLPSLMFGGFSSRTLGAAESLAYDRQSAMPYGDDGFAPEVEERVILRTATLRTEVNRGDFDAADSQMRSITENADAFILSENINLYGEGWKAYHVGSYRLKVDSTKYDAVVDQLKGLGEVKQFNENARDVTGSYTDLNTELELEKERMQRYQDMYDEATDVEDRIELSDRIFNQERTIRYLEERVENIDEKVDYTEISFTLSEKRSDYASITLVTLGNLVSSLVGSFNFMLRLIFIIVPWVVLWYIVKLALKMIRR